MTAWAAGGDRSVYFQYMDKATGKGRQYQITSSGGSTTPVLAPTGPEGGWLLWNGKSGYTVGDTLYYLSYGSDGVPGATQTANAPLSDCQPIPYGNGVVWYVTDNSAPTFYTLERLRGHRPSAGGRPAGDHPHAQRDAFALPDAHTHTHTYPDSRRPRRSPPPAPLPMSLPPAWYADYVTTAAEAGLMNGVGGGKFNPTGDHERGGGGHPHRPAPRRAPRHNGTRRLRGLVSGGLQLLHPERPVHRR